MSARKRAQRKAAAQERERKLTEIQRKRKANRSELRSTGAEKAPDADSADSRLVLKGDLNKVRERARKKREADERAKKTARMRVIPGGLPGHGKRR